MSRSMTSTALARTVYYDDVVPRAWIGRLRREIVRLGSPPIHWMDLGRAPRNFFEQVVHHLRGIVRPPETCVGVEYWGRSHAVDTGVRFHFDRDEARRDTIVCPVLGSIVYLSDVGGSTLVFDAGPTGSGLPSRGAGVVPVPGRLLTYAGQLLHGVQPDQPNHRPRVVFLVNWWATPPSVTREPPPDFCGNNPVLQRLPPRPRRAPRPATTFPAGDALDRESWKRVVAMARAWS